MKKIILLLLISISFVACNKVSKNEFIISGKANGVANGTNVFLQFQDTLGQLKAIDTVKVLNGKFEIKNKFDSKGKIDRGIALVEVDKIPGKVALILESGQITVDIRKDSVMKSKVGGTVSNDQLALYYKETEKVNKKIMAFQNANMAKFQEAQSKQDTATINGLMKENNKFQKEIEDISMSMLEKGSKSFLSLYFLQQFVNVPTADKAKLKKIYDGLDPDLKQTTIGKKLAKTFNKKA
jgi:hypothetical protein